MLGEYRSPFYTFSYTGIPSSSYEVICCTHFFHTLSLLNPSIEGLRNSHSVLAKPPRSRSFGCPKFCHAVDDTHLLSAVKH